jgi:hypothetical protein
MNARGLQTDVRGLRDRCEGLADGCNDVLRLFLFRVILFNLLNFCVALFLDLIFNVNFLSRTFVRILLCSSKIPSSTYLLDVLLRSLVERDNSDSLLSLSTKDRSKTSRRYVDDGIFDEHRRILTNVLDRKLTLKIRSRKRATQKLRRLNKMTRKRKRRRTSLHPSASPSHLSRNPLTSVCNPLAFIYKPLMCLPVSCICL